MGEGMGPLRRSIHRLSLTSSEERYGDLIDRAFSDFFVGWWGLWLLPLAPVARDPLNCPENMYHVLCWAFTL
jgi:hypothetical protein